MRPALRRLAGGSGPNTVGGLVSLARAGAPSSNVEGSSERRRRPARAGNRSSGRTRGEPMAPRSSAPATASARHDAVTATALSVVRRALIEGVPVTREVLEREASVNLDASPRDAMRQVDMVAQRPASPPSADPRHAPEGRAARPSCRCLAWRQHRREFGCGEEREPRTRPREVEDALHIGGTADQPELPTLRARGRVGLEHQMQPGGIQERYAAQIQHDTPRPNAVRARVARGSCPTVATSTSPNGQTRTTSPPSASRPERHWISPAPRHAGARVLHRHPNTPGTTRGAGLPGLPSRGRIAPL